VRERFGRELAPERAALLVRGDRAPFALVGDWAHGGALVGSEPVRMGRPDEDAFGLLDDHPLLPSSALEDDVVGGGWFGFLGYGLGRQVEPRTSAPPPRPTAFPAAALAYYDHLLRLGADGQWWFEALWTEERDTALGARLTELRRRADRLEASRRFSTTTFRPIPSWSGHAAAVAAARERIHHGDLFQANLAVRLEATLTGDPIDLFCAGVAALRPARAAYVAGEWGAIASLSPETFLRRHGRTVVSEPIKGTRAHDGRAELIASAKDRAENVMIVDLMRNDLGRVCEPGSVRVPSLFDVREHTGVWHAVSEVAGTLREGVGDGELLRATFPPGSVTGAPKPAALDVIAELESTGREAYTGAIGFASPWAGLELSVAIRTFECAPDGRIWLGVGGGVVADSEPEAEAREAATKAAPLLAAIGAEPVRASTDAVAPLVPRRFSPRPLPRPDPARGVLTTLAARGGRAVDAEAHLTRLATSVRELYGRDLPPDLGARLAAAAARSAEPARLRVLASPDGSAEIHRSPLPEATAASGDRVRLRTFVIPGGLGAHKWRDRRWIDALAAACGPEEIPLWTDLDGLVLEASRANVFIREGDLLVTPPADGRILPGVTRAALLARARVEPISYERLRAADAVLLTGACGARSPSPRSTGSPSPSAEPSGS
jgi:para-aminobenzoate synthetase/4-amino-4-deoxychorismate lyase